MSLLDTLDPKYTTILCDVWGVIHDGGVLLPGAKERLIRWEGEGRKVILVTNAPRPASTIERELLAFGLPRSCWDAVTSSGAAGIAALLDPPRPVGFLGNDDDRADLVGEGVELVDDGFTEIAAAGLEDWYDTLEDYRDRLLEWRDRDVLFHCLNPDRIVVHRGERLVCPGALADEYEALGGRVAWYGKPHAAIYEHALKLAGNPPRDTVLAIGDGPATDLVGAARQGQDAIFVTGGIHAGEELPDSFFRQHGLGDWRPLGSVETLA